MTSFLEIAQLENGDVVLREVREDEAAELPAVAPAVGEAAERVERGTVLVESGGLPAEQSTRGEPLVRIRFSREVRDLLGGELVDVAEAMIDAATEFLDTEGLDGLVDDPGDELPPVVH